MFDHENVTDEAKEELVNGDTEPLLVVQWSCLSPHGTKDDWLWMNIFQLTSTIWGKVCPFMIDYGSLENVISGVAVQKLELTTKRHPKPYKVA